jgi:hypothetical protein
LKNTKLFKLLITNFDRSILITVAGVVVKVFSLCVNILVKMLKGQKITKEFKFKSNYGVRESYFWGLTSSESLKMPYQTRRFHFKVGVDLEFLPPGRQLSL